MRMKKLTVVCLALLAVAMTIPLMAQSQADEIELTREMVQTERKAIVAENMQFSEAESRNFWPVYNEYVAEVRKVNDRRARLIVDYARAYENLTETQAEAFLKEAIEIDKAELKVKESFLPKFKKVLTSKRVARFYQIENKLDTIIDFGIASEIPLVHGK
jgi:hypothetical protein